MQKVEPRAPAVTIQALDPGEGWYVVWGPTAGQPETFQRIISFMLGTDGLTYVPLVINQATGAINQAQTISTDYQIDHPEHFRMNHLG